MGCRRCTLVYRWEKCLFLTLTVDSTDYLVDRHYGFADRHYGFADRQKNRPEFYGVKYHSTLPYGVNLQR